MNHEHMNPIEILIKDKKKTFKGEVVRAAIYAKNKVIHARTADQDDFYLVYFNHTFIYADKLEKIDEHSFIEKVFLDGIVIESTHPILSALIPNQTITIPNRSKIFSQLQTHYTPQEIAYIATTLDSFFDKDQLVKVIEQLYFDHRRNGKFMKAFQILQTTSDFMPPSAIERLASREFNSYHDFYHSSQLPTIFQKDPLYVEHYCFKNRFNPEVCSLFEEILMSKKYQVEIILLWLEKVERLKKAESIEKYTQIALKFVTMKEWIFILGKVNINPFIVLPEAKQVIEQMMEDGEYESAALALLKFLDKLPVTYDAILKKLWENLDAEFIVSHLDHFISILQKQGTNENQKQSEIQMTQMITSLLKSFDLKTVYDKLLPLKEVLPHSMVMRKLSKMVELLEDPNQMMDLGDYYVEFKQYDQAIDCYFWEMELKPQDPDPVRKICKMYQHKGMFKEAADYQKVFDQLKDAQ